MAVSRAVRGRLTSTQATSAREDLAQISSGYKLNPATLTAAQAEADQGRPRRLIETINDLRGRCGHLAGLEQVRRAALTGKPWELLPGRRGGVETPTIVVDACQDMLTSLKGWPGMLGDAQDAVLHPLSAFELTWEWSGSQLWPTAVQWVHPKRFHWNTTYENVPGLDLGELRLSVAASQAGRTSDAATYGERLRRDKWIIHQIRTRSDWPWRLGVGRAVAWMECFRGFSFAQWMTWLEVCATPLRLAEVPSNTQDDARARINAALDALGSDGYATLDETANVRFEGSGNQGGDQSYQRMVDTCASEMSKALLGHTGTVDVEPGRLGGESMAVEVAQWLVESDARAIEETMGECPLAPFVRYNWGPEIPAPILHLQVDAQISRRERMAMAKEAWAMGMPVDMEHLASSTGVRLTTDPSRAVPAPPQQAGLQQSAGVTAPQPAPGQPEPVGGEEPAPGSGVSGGGAQDPAEPEPGAVDPTTSLNGAQVTALLDILAQVSAGTLPRETGLQVIMAAFGMARELAEQIMGDLGLGEPAPVEVDG